MKRNYCLSFVLLTLFGMSSFCSAVAANMENIIPSSQSTQQVKKITGKVVDTAGEPIIGASVSIRGTNSGAITNLDGAFSLSASIGSILVVSYIGYQTTEIRVGPTNSYTVTLKDDSKALEEVVVTAMGIKKEKKDISFQFH